MSNFHSLEVVGRGSETQLQVSENSGMMTIKIIQITVYRGEHSRLYSFRNYIKSANGFHLFHAFLLFTKTFQLYIYLLSLYIPRSLRINWHL